MTKTQAKPKTIEIGDIAIPAQMRAARRVAHRGAVYAGRTLEHTFDQPHAGGTTDVVYDQARFTVAILPLDDGHRVPVRGLQFRTRRIGGAPLVVLL